MKAKRALVPAVCLLALVVPSAVISGPATAHGRHRSDPAVITDWIAVATRAMFPPPPAAATPIPTGQLYLGFMSIAVLDAVDTAREEQHRGRHPSTTAAAAFAAHDVLVEYLPTSTAAFDAALVDSLGTVPDGWRKSRGIEIGAESADEMIAARVNDGRDAAITYDKPVGVGVWRPTTPGAVMALPWFGFVEPLLLDSPTQIQPGGPDALASEEYAADFAEVKTMGAATGSARTAKQTETALFFNDNMTRQMQDSLRNLAGQQQLGLRKRARLFALVNAATADSLITCWRQKYDVGYWRPVTAIHEAADDGNPETSADLDWQPLVTTPPYPEYASGHACITGAVTKSLTRFTGSQRIDLTVKSLATGTVRQYRTAQALEHDAFNARIWLGIHFRDAMEDGYYIGHRSARLGSNRLF